MLKITKNIFFGRNNPFGIIHEPQASNILKYISSNQDAINISPNILLPGFVGITVEILDHTSALKFGLPMVFDVSDGHAKDISASRKLGQLLLNEAEVTLSNESETFNSCGQMLRNVSYNSSDKARRDSQETHFKSGMTHGSTVQYATYNSAWWNDPAHLRGNNCYAYACNVRTDGNTQSSWPHPGFCQKSKIPESNEELLEGVRNDRIIRLEEGMNPVNGSNESPAWIVGLAAGIPNNEETWDYHWYRKVWHGNNSDSYYWGHKPGASMATYTDDVEEDAKKRGYDWLGYFAIQNVTICASM
ncbi:MULTISPECIES: hypothetical protein [Photorhabdus]|uniref:Uncharacterized protein n=2 Tax=Photorhabdus TaxID=29487 RepID=A0A7X5QQN5_9GAMM|nr:MULTISPECIES: hypothetical protein [Photorhabdus]ETS32005.1 hypothetical protein PTE_01761 [Photorhabdus khanii NC19]NHB98547.1 hypothetical protein [Photorhabdus stackebrandtii]